MNNKITSGFVFPIISIIQCIIKKLSEGVILLAWTPSSICIIFHIVLSHIQWVLVTILNYLLRIFWLLFSFYFIGLLVILKKNITCITLKHINRTPCMRPKFVATFCVNLLCLLFTLLAAIGWQTVNLQINQTVKYQGEFSRIAGFSGKRFLPSHRPPLLVHPSIFDFFCFPSNSVTQLETLSDEG